jgi:hypothetical protein
MDEDSEHWKDDMELEEKVESFNMLCMSDPFSIKSGFDDTLDRAKLLKFKDEIYPKEQKSIKLLEAFKGDSIPVEPWSAVKCIFLPSREMCQIMIKALIKHGAKEDSTAFLLRFCLLEK